MADPKKKKQKNSIGELSSKEIGLIRIIRERFQWGEIKILVRNGQPYRVASAVEYEEPEDWDD